jgi:hypothetical protein
MKLIGKPFGYVLWSAFAGTCAGIASGGITSPNFPIDGIAGAVLGAFAGFGIERRASRLSAQEGGWQRFWTQCLAVCIVPALLYVTITALGVTYLMWFPQQARE